MDHEAWRAAIAHLNKEIRTIVNAQRRSDEVNDPVAEQSPDLLDADWIDSELPDGVSAAIAEREWRGVRMQVRRLGGRHLTLRDVTGVDLMYQIAGRRYVQIQYSSAQDGQLLAAPNQFDTPVAACPEVPCPAPSAWTQCGSWHCAQDANGGRYHPACEAAAIFAGRKSQPEWAFANGLSMQTFDELFALGRIGAPMPQVGSPDGPWADMQRERILFAVLQL